ncbi:MAG: PD40 domain-containing protein [Prevotella sp.]|nr:PD40 domain-containing protein [Prevotella sp.]
MKRKDIYTYMATAFLMLLTACTPTPQDVKQSDQEADIYPDYKDVTIPVNIAPMNFLVRDAEAVEVTAGDLTVRSRGGNVEFGKGEWRELLEGNDTIAVKVTALKDGQWTAYKQFHWYVVADSIDSYLTYRLIEPGYSVWNRLQIIQRCVENFDEYALADYNLQENRCMNCHTPCSKNPQLSMLYVRGEGGGAILNQNGRLRKLNIKTPEMVATSTYFQFSPSGRYIVFSSNVVVPAVHSMPQRRLEVYDTESDIYVADLEKNLIIHSELLALPDRLETFPAFSPDGKYIYYCTSPKVELPEDYKSLKYALARIPFDETTGTIGTQVDTLFTERSVCHPRVSPDGERILFSVQDFATFPIWHKEADLWMIDLRTGATDTLQVVNSDMCETYHSWSSNSRWFVFASKRDDGLYGKPYFCYVDRNGKAHKPFCLPQKDPTFYDDFLKSFNAPEMAKGKIPFNAVDVAEIMKRPAEAFKWE